MDGGEEEGGEEEGGKRKGGKRKEGKRNNNIQNYEEIFLLLTLILTLIYIICINIIKS